MTATLVPSGFSDPVNQAILAVSEDRLSGFQRDPFAEIAARSGLSPEAVIERIRAMLAAGTIRRVRQTLVSTNLAEGALVAWSLPGEALDAAFDFMWRHDPYSGHVVLRSTDPGTAGSGYRLWTTLKVPQGFSLQAHAEFLAGRVRAVAYRLMPARALFALGVGHARRRGIQPGSRAEMPSEVLAVARVALTGEEWRVIEALKREFEPQELVRDLWASRAREAGMGLEAFRGLAESLDRRKLLGRFSTFVEHVKPLADGERVTRYNALFHWAVPRGREVEAGREVGRHHIVTHAYWREAGPEFASVNIMAVVHGDAKGDLLAHKAAIDAHLAEQGLDVTYTNVFWGGRSEIKPSEISPASYPIWCREMGLDPDRMRSG